MNYSKELMKDIDALWPFYGTGIPKTVRCTDICASERGIAYLSGDDDAIDAAYWSAAVFTGKYIDVKFFCSEKFGRICISLGDMQVAKFPAKNDILIEELDFVKQVLEQSD